MFFEIFLLHLSWNSFLFLENFFGYAKIETKLELFLYGGEILLLGHVILVSWNSFCMMEIMGLATPEIFILFFQDDLII